MSERGFMCGAPEVPRAVGPERFLCSVALARLALFTMTFLTRICPQTAHAAPVCQCPGGSRMVLAAIRGLPCSFCGGRHG